MSARREAIGRVALALLSVRGDQRPRGGFDGSARIWLVDHGLATSTDRGLWHFQLSPLGEELANHIEAYFEQLLEGKKATGQLRRPATNDQEEVTNTHDDAHEQEGRNSEGNDEEVKRLEASGVFGGTKARRAAKDKPTRSGSKARKAKGTTSTP